MGVIGRHGSHGEMATVNTILRVRTGSVAHGITIESSDRDETGICIEPPEYVIGLRDFEQYQYRDAAERTGKLDARSAAGDLDLTIYSLRKYMRLALNGNPSIIETLFITRPEDIIVSTPVAHALRALTPKIISREAGPRYLGYLHAQRRSMMSHEGKGRDVTRPELVEKHGYDTKYAGHMVRLGLQGLELMETGRIALPMIASDQMVIRSVRQGQWPMESVLEYTERLERQLKASIDASKLPDHPDRSALDDWLAATYQFWWDK